VVVLWANTTGVAIAHTMPSRVFLIFIIALGCGRPPRLKYAERARQEFVFVSLAVTRKSFESCVRVVGSPLTIL
jgi:hypothetical protein